MNADGPFSKNNEPQVRSIAQKLVEKRSFAEDTHSVARPQLKPHHQQQLQQSRN
jgi:hypothetical protein